MIFAYFVTSDKNIGHLNFTKSTAEIYTILFGVRDLKHANEVLMKIESETHRGFV